MIYHKNEYIISVSTRSCLSPSSSIMLSRFVLCLNLSWTFQCRCLCIFFSYKTIRLYFSTFLLRRPEKVKYFIRDQYFSSKFIDFSSGFPRLCEFFIFWVGWLHFLRSYWNLNYKSWFGLFFGGFLKFSKEEEST